MRKVGSKSRGKNKWNTQKMRKRKTAKQGKQNEKDGDEDELEPLKKRAMQRKQTAKRMGRTA